MKIGHTNELRRGEAFPAAAEGRAVASGAPVEAIDAGERIDLSSASRNLAGATPDARDDTVRQYKVDEIRRAIQEGRFHVSAEAVADRMISEAAELLETIAARIGK